KNSGHLRPEIESRKFRAEQTHVTGGDKFVGRTSKIEIRVQRATLKRGAFGKNDAEGGQERFKILCGHVLAIELDVEDGLLSGLVGAVEMRCSIADLQRRRIEDACILAQIVLGAEFNDHRLRGR